MSSDTVYSAVKAYLTANWTATTIKWENETFTVPSHTDYPATPAAWIAVEFSGGLYQQTSIGAGSASANRWQESGTVLIYCVVQSNAGALLAHQLASQLAALFRGLILGSDIQFRDLQMGGGGPGDEEGNWWQLLFRAEWTRG